jgi:hypothetical protein
MEVGKTRLDSGALEMTRLNRYTAAKETRMNQKNRTSTSEIVDDSGLERSRRMKAYDIIRRADTVSLLTCEEVDAIINRAMAGEFDDMELD